MKTFFFIKIFFTHKFDFEVYYSAWDFFRNEGGLSELDPDVFSVMIMKYILQNNQAGRLRNEGIWWRVGVRKMVSDWVHRNIPE